MITRVEKQNEKIERALSHLPGIDPSEELKNRILLDAQKEFSTNPAPLLWPFGKIWQPVALMAVSLALGIWVGTLTVKIESGYIDDEIETMLMG